MKSFTRLSYVYIILDDDFFFSRTTKKGELFFISTKLFNHFIRIDVNRYQINICSAIEIKKINKITILVCDILHILRTNNNGFSNIFICKNINFCLQTIL